MEKRNRRIGHVVCLSWIILAVSTEAWHDSSKQRVNRNKKQTQFNFHWEQSHGASGIPSTGESNCTFCSFSAVCLSSTNTVDSLLHNLPEDVQDLVLIVTNEKLGEFNPVDNHLINLTGISRLTRLQNFQIKMDPDQMMMFEPNQLVYLDDTFTRLTSLKHLAVNVPLGNRTDLMHMLRPLHSLEVLDLSHTAMLSQKTVSSALDALNKTSLKKLSLSNFQTVGSKGFSHQLSASSLFGRSQPLNVTYLDLSHNYLGLIHSNISFTLPNLTTLNVSYNMLVLERNTGFYIEIFLQERLQTFNCGHQGFPLSDSDKTSEETSKPQSNTRPTFIGNGIAYSWLLISCINQLVQQNVSKIMHNNTAFCEIISCVTDQSIPFQCQLLGTLSELYDSSCCIGVQLPFFKNLRDINMDNLNWIMPEGVQMGGKLCFRGAKVVNFSFRNNQYLFRNQYVGDSMNSFENIVGINEFEKMDFSNNKANFILPFNATHIFTMLTIVELPNNNVIFRNKSVCEKWPNLKRLNVHRNSLRDGILAHMAFHNCSKLEELDLSNNQLTMNSVFINIEGNVKLHWLNLSNNQITSLSKKLREDLDYIARYQLQSSGVIQVSLNLSNNPLQCSCTEQDLDFSRWLLQTKIPIHLGNQILCNGNKGLYVLNTVTWQQLHGDCSQTGIIVKSVSITGSVAILVSMISVMYLFRWKLRYHLFKVSEQLRKFWSSQSQLQPIPGGSWMYDVFVSYCADDRFWVHDGLMKTLEDKYGFRLCIHYRDFPVGGTISSAIIQAIKQSNRLILVVSDRSICRPWCHFEVETACTEVKNRGTKLLVIKLGNFIPPENVQAVIKNNICLQWSDHPEAENLFWKKLISNLYG